MPLLDAAEVLIGKSSEKREQSDGEMVLEKAKGEKDEPSSMGLSLPSTETEGIFTQLKFHIHKGNVSIMSIPFPLPCKAASTTEA